MAPAGIDIMTERRSTDPSASRDIRNRAKGFEKHLCKQPCNVGKALGLYEALDGASLFKPPFRLYRPIKLATTLLNGARANIAKGVDLPLALGHADYKEWLKPAARPREGAVNIRIPADFEPHGSGGPSRLVRRPGSRRRYPPSLVGPIRSHLEGLRVGYQCFVSFPTSGSTDGLTTSGALV